MGGPQEVLQSLAKGGYVIRSWESWITIWESKGIFYRMAAQENERWRSDHRPYGYPEAPVVCVQSVHRGASL